MKNNLVNLSLSDLDKLRQEFKILDFTAHNINTDSPQINNLMQKIINLTALGLAEINIVIEEKILQNNKKKK